MKPSCPWCQLELDSSFVRNLGKYPEPCPHCEKPVRCSIWQVMFIVLSLMPLIAVTLGLSEAAFDNGSVVLSVIAFLAGTLLSIYLQRLLPTLHGPSKGGGSAGSGDN